jgi:hypothetical protein
MDPSEKKRQKDKKRQFNRRRKEFFSEERKSIRREKREMRLTNASMRKRIRRAKMESFKNGLRDFFSNLFRKKKLSGSEKFIRKKFREDTHQRNLNKIYHLPAELKNSITRFWQNRLRLVIVISRSISSFIGFTGTALSSGELRNGYFKTLINSMTLFLLSFLLVYFVHQFATIFTAKAFDIPTKLYSYRIDWPLYTYSYLYTRKALVVIFGMGPLVCLVLGIGFFRLFLWTRFRTVFLKTFSLWTAFHAINLFFGAYIVGVITRTGFVYTSEWLFLSNIFDVEEIVLMIVSIVVLLIVGYYSTRQFLYASDSSVIIEPKYRILYLLSKVLIPWLAGTLVLYAVNIPKNPLELILLYGTSALIVIPVFSNYNSTNMQMLKLPRVPDKFRIGWVYILITIIAIFATRLLLKSGISFY